MTDTLPPVAKPRPHQTLRIVAALLNRDMATSYGRSPGGLIWLVLEPLGGIVLLAVVIGVGFRIRTPALGTNFILFFATGILMLTMFLMFANRIGNAISSARPLLKYPGVIFTDVLMARFLLVLLTQLLVYFLILFGIHLVFDLHTIPRYGAIAHGLAMAVLLGTGVGLCNSLLFEVWPIWRNMWSILTRPLFIVSPVIYIFEDIPKQWQDVGWYNPLAHIIGMVRRGIYITYDAQYVSLIYGYGLGAFLTLVGLALLYRFNNEIINR